jgi:hypothetical protein
MRKRRQRLLRSSMRRLSRKKVTRMRFLTSRKELRAMKRESPLSLKKRRRLLLIKRSSISKLRWKNTRNI